MARNRWVGQAAAVQEVRFYTPMNIKPGDRFQLSDGVNRFAFTYPAIRPEHDETDVDMADRVVRELIARADNSVDGLGGGTTSGLQFSTSSINGIPSVRVDGLSDGRPIGLIASAKASETNPIRIARLQEGVAGKDMVFRIDWPTTPTLGKWAIASSGKKPVILDFDATASEVEAALDSFEMPASTITVTGSHSTGYLVTLSGLTEVMKYPPLMFPMVPPARVNQVVELDLDDASSYQFGVEAYHNNWFDAGISANDLKTYLGNVGMSGLHIANMAITRTERVQTVGYEPGAKYSITFASDAAYDAFMEMPKWKIPYVYTVEASSSTTIDSDSFAISANAIFGGGARRKLRIKLAQATLGTGTLNPMDRNWYSVYATDMTGSGAATLSNLTILSNSLISGYDPSLVTCPPAKFCVNYLSHPDSFTIKNQLTLSNASTVTLTTGQVEMARGVPQVAIPLSVTVTAGLDSSQLGVDANAGYRIETIGQPGIINKVVVLPALDSSAMSLYQFEYNGKKSHKFSGVSGRVEIKDAAESLFGAGNVIVSASENGSYQIEFGGSLSEQDVDFTLHTPSGVDDGTGLNVLIPAETPMKEWVLKYTFTGGVCGGRWRFLDHSGSPVGNDFKIISSTEFTAEDVRNSLRQISEVYDNVLEASDIEIESEAIGDRFILRGFTITFQAQPTANQSGTAEVPFWVNIDVGDLLAAEPAVSVQSYGLPSSAEMQLIAIENGPTSGQWKLKYGSDETTALNHNATASNVQSALTAISQTTTVIGQNGGPFRVVWSGTGAKNYLEAINVSLESSAAPVLDTTIGTVGTGPNHFDNADNWSLGRVPQADDAVIFADGDVSCMYGLNSSVVIKSLDVYRSWTGRLGLPEVREDGSIETLNGWLALTATSSDALPVRIGIGSEGAGPTLIRVAVSNRHYLANVQYSQSGTQRNRCVGFKGTSAKNEMTIIGGEVSLGVRPEDSAYLKSLRLFPSGSSDSLSFNSGDGTTIDNAQILGGDVLFNVPPKSITTTNADIMVNGQGDCHLLSVGSGTVRWMAGGKIGQSGEAEEVWFGNLDEGIYGDIDGGDAYSTYSGGGGSGGAMSQTSSEPAGVRFICNDHGLSFGDRIYIRAYSGVLGLDGKIFSIRVTGPDSFDLLGSQGWGTLVGYEGQVHWAKVDAVFVRDAGVLDFDSDSNTHDIVGPVILQGSGQILDSKGTVRDLRIRPEQVEALAFLGTGIEVRRVNL